MILLFTPSTVRSAAFLRHHILRWSITDSYHRFIAEECDWGFTRFAELRKLFNVQKGAVRPTVEKESADITVYVRVLEDPTGVLWHNFVKYVDHLKVNDFGHSFIMC